MFYYHEVPTREAMRTLGSATWERAMLATWQASRELGIDCPRVAWVKAIDAPDPNASADQVFSSPFKMSGQFHGRYPDRIAILCQPDENSVVRSVAHECKHVRQWCSHEFGLSQVANRALEPACIEYEDDFAARFFGGCATASKSAPATV